MAVAEESERSWTLQTASQIFPDVRERTERAVEEVEALVERREREPADSPERAELDSQLRTAVSRWVRAMEALGVGVKGLWLIDFDNGSGYYCWKWPEDELSYFHGYEEGFGGRVRIQ